MINLVHAGKVFEFLTRRYVFKVLLYLCVTEDDKDCSWEYRKMRDVPKIFFVFDFLRTEKDWFGNWARIIVSCCASGWVEAASGGRGLEIACDSHPA